MNKSKAAILASALVAMVAAYPAGADEAAEAPATKRLAAIRHEQALAWAKQDGVELTASVEDFFLAAQTGAWAAVRAPFDALGREYSEHELHQSDSNVTERALESPWMYPLVMDVYAAYELEHFWTPELLDQYASDVLSDIPDGSICFGRSDITAWAVTHRPGNVFVIIQNGLISGDYLEFLARLYPAGIWLPNRQYVADAQTKFEEEMLSDNRPQTPEYGSYLCRLFASNCWPPEGLDRAQARQIYKEKIASGEWPRFKWDSLTSMEVIGLLSKEIFERNKLNHACFIDRPYEHSWMDPYLVPHGPIMQLTKERPGVMPADLAGQDRLFWDEKERQLLGDDRVMARPPARRTYSECRTAIAGLYLTRGMTNESEYAFHQAIRIYPLLDRPYFALARDVLYPQGRFEEARAVIQALRAAGPDVHLIAEIEDWAKIEDKAAYEKGSQDAFNERIHQHLEHIANELGKQTAPQSQTNGITGRGEE